MPNKRDSSKKVLGFYATPEEKKAIESLAKARGVSVAELLRMIATGAIKLSLLVLLCAHVTRSPRNWSAGALKQTVVAAVSWSSAQLNSITQK